jgi:hypothetical protein
VERTRLINLPRKSEAPVAPQPLISPTQEG